MPISTSTVIAPASQPAIISKGQGIVHPGAFADGAQLPPPAMRTTTGGSASTCTAGCGTCTAASASGTSHHSSGIASAPQARCSNRRSPSTSATASVNTQIIRAAWLTHVEAMASRVFITELLEQLAQFGDVLFRELLLLGEVRHQRGDAAAEQAIEQALAGLVYVFLARQQRAVEVAAAVALGLHRLLLEEPVEQGFHRALLPLLCRPDLGEDLFGAARRAAPQHFHHDGFGFTDHGASRLRV